MAAAPELVFETTDFLSQGEWIEARHLPCELLLFFFSQVPAVDEALRGGAAFLFMTPDLAASFAPFAFLFHRHAEEVAPLAPELEKVVEDIQQLAVFEPFVTEKLPDVGVVFLFDVCLVVFEVGAGAGLVDAVFFQPLVEMVVQKLAAVVAVHAEEIEGLAFPDGLQCLEAGVLAAVPHGAQFRPTA